MIDIIPAIDIIDGKCVRLSQGNYAQKTVYSAAPLEVARSFEAIGVRRLHLVDLDGAKAQHIVNYRVLEEIATHTSLTIDFGGGLKTDDDLRQAFDSGAAMITGGSIAVKNPAVFESWIERFGAERIILGADVHGEQIAIGGWTETTSLLLMPFLAHYIGKGINQVICTDISRDGMLEGSSVELYKKILAQHPDLHLIASGGIGSAQDIKDLEAAGVPAVITGKAIYEGKIDLKKMINLAVKGCQLTS